MKKMFAATILFASFALLPTFIQAQAQQRQTKRLTIPSGKTTVSANGSITGYQDIDYIINASAGQTLSVTLKTNKSSNYFLVYGPNDKETAIYNSDVNPQTWTKTVEEGGDYTVRVYLYRNAARNNVKATFTVTVKRTGTASSAGNTAATPKYDATGILRSSMAPGDPVGSFQAKFGVMRYPSGDAEITVTNHLNEKRVFVFYKTQQRFECTTPAGASIKYARNAGSDSWYLTLNGKETYEIVDAVMQGG